MQNAEVIEIDLCVHESMKIGNLATLSVLKHIKIQTNSRREFDGNLLEINEWSEVLEFNIAWFRDTARDSMMKAPTLTSQDNYIKMHIYPCGVDTAIDIVIRRLPQYRQLSAMQQLLQRMWESTSTLTA